jgi:hypothetical protein
MRAFIFFIFIAIIFSSCRTKKPCEGVASIEQIIEKNNGVINGDSIRAIY